MSEPMIHTQMHHGWQAHTGWARIEPNPWEVLGGHQSKHYATTTRDSNQGSLVGVDKASSVGLYF